MDWDPADLSRNVYRLGRQGRALRLQVRGRSYTYAQVGGKRGHELARPGEADALAVVMEAVYTRNLTTAGALVSIPGCFLNRCNFL